MKYEERLAKYFQVIDETATNISQAYVAHRDWVGHFLGQTSPMVSLHLFRYLSLETSLYLLSLLDSSSQMYKAIKQETKNLAFDLHESTIEERLTAYAQDDDNINYFAKACQQIVYSDSLWQSMRIKQTLPHLDISDPAYVVIKSAAINIEQLVLNNEVDERNI